MKAVFTKNELAFLKSYKEINGVYTFVFKTDNDLAWKAGQHGLFTITHRKVKPATKPFSIAAAPAENVIKITTKINDNPSDFKKALLELKEGMTITMSGPVGSFHLSDSSPTLLLAGGIGITPFRAIVKQLEAEGTSGGSPIKLLYLDSKKSFIFKEELDEIANNTSVNVSFLDTREGLYQEIDKFKNQYQDSNYFIAGPKSMVDSVSAYLKTNGIPKKNIKRDVLDGY